MNKTLRASALAVMRLSYCRSAARTGYSALGASNDQQLNAAVVFAD